MIVIIILRYTFYACLIGLIIVLAIAYTDTLIFGWGDQCHINACMQVPPQKIRAY